MSNQVNITNALTVANVTVDTSNSTQVNVNNSSKVANVTIETASNVNVAISRTVIGTVANVLSANYANYAGNAFAVDGANVHGPVANANYAANANNANHANVSNSANSVAVANVVGIGNIAIINLDGNASNILYGNGVFGPDTGPSNVANANYANFAGTAYNVSGSNVSGAVANAQYAITAGTAYSVSGSNVSGAVANANYATNAGSATTANTANQANVANTANSVAVANVVGIGNISTVNLDGNASHVLYGNGVFSAVTSPSNVANANYANFAGTAYNVSAANVSGLGNIATINLNGNASNFLDGTGNWTSAPSSANANYANFAGNVINSAQPNIKSLGNLTSLTINNGIANTPTYQFNPNLFALPTSFAAPNALSVIKSSGSSANLIQVDPQYLIKDRPGNAAAGSSDFISRVVYAANSSANGNIVIAGDNFVRLGAAPNVANTWVPASFTWRFATSGTNLANSGTFTTATLAMNTLGGMLYTLGAPTQLAMFSVSGYGQQNGAIGNTANSTGIAISRSRGNSDVRLSVEPNDYIGDLTWVGTTANGTTGTQTAKLRARVDSTYTSNTTNMPIGIELQTVGNGGALNTHNFYANGNVAFNNAISANVITANYLYGDGSNITGIAATNANYANFAGTAYSVSGANVSGTVANATYAGTAYSVSGSNVSGDVAGANHANIADAANVAYSVNAANVSGLGNIALINLDGNAANILYGNGVFGPDTGPTNVANANYANFAGTAYSVSGSNVSGAVANATYAANAGTANIANVAYSVSGSNVSGQVANALIAGTVYTNAQPNITSVGTLTSLTVNDGITANTLSLLNTITPITANVGQMFWDTAEQTVTLGMNNGVQQQIGLESYIIVRANSAITNGQAVMYVGSNGNHVLAAPADISASGFDPSKILGIATQNITINTDGYITTTGQVHGLNTNAFNEGDILYATATPGVLSNTPPASPAYHVQVGTVVKKSGGAGIIQVLVNGLPKVADLSDVTITSGVAGQALILSSSNTWVNGNPNVANIANVAYSVSGANVSGTVADATYAANAGNAYSVSAANVTGLGNIATINLNGSTTQVLYGNGVFANIATPTNVANANYANFAGTAYSVSGANVSGTVANATYAANAGNANIANIAYSVSAANVSGLGNIATINLNGNTSTVLSGNGAWVAQTGSSVEPFNVFLLAGL